MQEGQQRQAHHLAAEADHQERPVLRATSREARLLRKVQRAVELEVGEVGDEERHRRVDVVPAEVEVRGPRPTTASSKCGPSLRSTMSVIMLTTTPEAPTTPKRSSSVRLRRWRAEQRASRGSHATRLPTPARRAWRRLPRIGPMTQQPFSRPGAIDLSGLGKPAPQAGAPATPTGTPAGAGSSYSVVVDEAELPGPPRAVDDGAGAPGLLLAAAGCPRASSWPTTSRRSWPSTRAATSSVSSTSTRCRRSPRRCRSRRSRSSWPWWTVDRCRSCRTPCRSTSCAPR